MYDCKFSTKKQIDESWRITQKQKGALSFDKSAFSQILN